MMLKKAMTDDERLWFAKVGARLEKARVEAKISQELLASYANVCGKTVYDIENAKNAPNLLTLVRLANALGLPLNTLIK